MVANGDTPLWSKAASRFREMNAHAICALVEGALKAVVACGGDALALPVDATVLAGAFVLVIAG